MRRAIFNRWSAFALLQHLGAALSLLLLFGISHPAPTVETSPIETHFDGHRAYALVSELSLQYPSRVTGTPEDEAAAAWVAARFRELGLQVEQQRFSVWGLLDLTAAGRYQGVNVLGISPGELDRAIVIGAHRDIVPETVQGAVDNASGTGTMLELARVLTSTPHRYTYIFASWGAEEVGLGGSRYYAGNPLRPTALALSVDVTGLVQHERSHLLLIDWASLPLEPALLVEQLALERGLIARPQQRDWLDLMGLYLTGGAATDSSPFALQGIPALGIGWETPHGHIIHTRWDTLEQVDAESLEQAGRLAEALVRAAEARPQAFLDGPPLFLRYPDGSLVPPIQVQLALLVIVLFAVASPVRLYLRARGAGLDVAAGLRTHSTLLAAPLAVAAGLPLLAWLLGLWSRPDLSLLLAWGGAAVLALLPVAWVARRSAPRPSLERRLALAALAAAVFLLLASIADSFLVAFLLGYALLVLPWLSFRRGWWVALDTLLLLPWLAVGLGLLLLTQVYGSSFPEFAPAFRVGLFQALLGLLLYASIGLSLAPTVDPRSRD